MFILAVCLFSGAVLFESSNTQELVRQLFNQTYDVDMKPSDNLTLVTITPNTFILLSMDQQQETIQYSQEFLFSWFDPLMHWNRTEMKYDREWVKLPASKVWQPDVVFTNAIKMNNILNPDQQTVDLHYTGRVRTSLPAVISSPCPLKIENFPYDVQECNITLGPWNFDSGSVAVQSSVDDILPFKSRFEGNSEWELLSITSVRSDNFDYTMDEPFSEITFTVKLKRKPVYYVLVIQAPTFILCTLTIFGIFSPNCSEDERASKVPLCLNMFAAISMMLNLVSDMMPKASRLPLLGNYIIAEVFVVSAATIASIVVHMIHHQVFTTGGVPPNWLRSLVLFDCKSRRKISEVSTFRSYELPEVVVNISHFNIIKDSIQQTAFVVRTAIDRMQTVANNQLTWLKILDRVDIFLLFLFQGANIVVTAIFWR